MPTEVPPKFANNEEAIRFWGRGSVSRNVPKEPGKYGRMTREQARTVFHKNQADLFIRKDSENGLELYRVVCLREEYAEHRETVRKLNVELHEWVNWTGTQA